MPMQALRRFFVITLIALTACAPQSKYPYQPLYAAPDNVPARVLDVPPAPHSAAHEQALETIIAYQKTVTKEARAEIRAEIPVRPEMMIQAIWGKNVTRDTHPALYELLRKTGSDAWRIGDSAKEYWRTTRPWLVDKRVKLLVDPIYSYAYPSGHTTTGHVWAAVLSDLDREHSRLFYARANEISHNRIIAGAHYPHDVKAGKRLAHLVATRFHLSEAYRQELAKAQAELAAKPLPATIYTPKTKKGLCGTCRHQCQKCKKCAAHSANKQGGCCKKHCKHKRGRQKPTVTLGTAPAL